MNQKHDMFKQQGIVILGGGGVEQDDAGQYFARTPIASYLHDLANEFGHVIFFAVKYPGLDRQFESHLDPNRIKVVLVSMMQLHTIASKLYTLCSIAHLVAKYSYSAYGVIAFYPAAGAWLSYILLRLVSRRYLVYFGMDPRKRWTYLSAQGLVGRIKWAYFMLSEKVALAGADKVLVRDATQNAWLAERIPEKVVLSKPISGIMKTNVLRHDTCTDKKVHLLFVGKLSRRKGVEDLLRAIALLETATELSNRSIVLTLVGSESIGEDNISPTTIMSLACELGIEMQVDLVGYIDDMDKLSTFFESADIFVLPSHREGFPRVLDEAIVFNLPIVTTSLPEIEVILKNRIHALLVEPEEPLQIAEAVKTIILCPKLRQTLINETRKLAREQFNETASEQHAQLLRSISSKH